MIIKNKGKRKEKKRKKYYEAVEELEVDGRIAALWHQCYNRWYS